MANHVHHDKTLAVSYKNNNNFRTNDFEWKRSYKNNRRSKINSSIARDQNIQHNC